MDSGQRTSVGTLANTATTTATTTRGKNPALRHDYNFCRPRRPGLSLMTVIISEATSQTASVNRRQMVGAESRSWPNTVAKRHLQEAHLRLRNSSIPP